MNSTDAATLRVLLERATPVPWVALPPDKADVFVPIIGLLLDESGEPVETPTNGLVAGAMLYPTEIDAEDYERAEANAALVVGAVNALPALLKALAAYQQATPTPAEPTDEALIVVRNAFDDRSVARKNIALRRAHDAITAALAERDALAQVLQPFADEADNYDFGDGSGPDLKDAPDESSIHEVNDLLVGHLRRARDTIAGRGALKLGARMMQECRDEWRARATAAEAKVAALTEALTPFVSEFEVRREAYIRRYPRNPGVGAINFDAMPDHWKMEKLEFTMGDFRLARAALASNEGGVR